VHDPGDRCWCRKWKPPRGSTYGDFCHWCTGVCGGVRLHAHGLPQFIMHKLFTLFCVCRFTVLYSLLCTWVCVCVCVCMHYDSNALWQNDHTLLPTAPGNLSSPLFSLLPPLRGAMCFHICQSLIPCGQQHSIASCSFSFLPAPIISGVFLMLNNLPNRNHIQKNIQTL